MGCWKKAAPVVETALVLLAGIVAGDFMSRGQLYRRARSLWYRMHVRLPELRRSFAGENPTEAHTTLRSFVNVRTGREMERRLYPVCTTARIKLMDDQYTNITTSRIRQVWKEGGTSGVTKTNMCEYKGDCDEASRITLGWIQERYPPAAAGLICGKLKDGRTHAEIIFWNGKCFRTFNPRDGTFSYLTARFARTYFILM